jgi:hypothetical protein
MKRTHLAIADELVLEHEPNLARDDITLLGDVLLLTGDRAEDLGGMTLSKCSHVGSFTQGVRGH